MKMLRKWIEELQESLDEANEHVDHLDKRLDKVLARLADRNRACNDLARQRDKWHERACENSAELDKLRQVPAGDAHTRLAEDNAQYRAALKENEALRGPMLAIRTHLGLPESADWPDVAERVASLVACNAQRHEKWMAAAGECDLESREVVPRYEVRQLVHPEHASQVVGYSIYDTLTKTTHGKWVSNSDYSLDVCQAEAIAHMERMNRLEADRLDEAADRGGR